MTKRGTRFPHAQHRDRQGGSTGRMNRDGVFGSHALGAQPGGDGITPAIDLRIGERRFASDKGSARVGAKTGGDGSCPLGAQREGGIGWG